MGFNSKFFVWRNCFKCWAKSLQALLWICTQMWACQSVIKRHLKDLTFNRDLSIYQFYALLTSLGFEVVSFEESWFIQFNPLRTQAITRLSSANGIVEYYVNRIGWIHIKHVHMVVNVCYNVCTLYTFAYIHKYRYWQFKRLCFIAAWIATTMYFPI